METLNITLSELKAKLHARKVRIAWNNGHFLCGCCTCCGCSCP